MQPFFPIYIMYHILQYEIYITLKSVEKTQKENKLKNKACKHQTENYNPIIYEREVQKGYTPSPSLSKRQKASRNSPIRFSLSTSFMLMNWQQIHS